MLRSGVSILMLYAYVACQLAATPHTHPGEQPHDASWRPHIHVHGDAPCHDHAADHAAQVATRHGHAGAACREGNPACANGHVACAEDDHGNTVYLALAAEVAIRAGDGALLASPLDCQSTSSTVAVASLDAIDLRLMEPPDSPVPHCAPFLRLRSLRI